MRRTLIKNIPYPDHKLVHPYKAQTLEGLCVPIYLNLETPVNTTWDKRRN